MVSRAYMPAAWMDPGLRRDDVRACVGPRAILYASGVISQRRHPRGGGDLSKHRVERTAPLRHSLRPSRKRRVTSTRCAAWRSHRRHEKPMQSAPAPGAVVSKEKAGALARSACRDSESTGPVWEVPYSSEGWYPMRTDHWPVRYAWASGRYSLVPPALTCRSPPISSTVSRLSVNQRGEVGAVCGRGGGRG
jgi:hypothetical protein